jgi:hypothetical protein
MAAIHKSAFVGTAQAISSTEMPDEVRITLVEKLVRLYSQLNSDFRADEFRFQCRVYLCKNCDTITAGPLTNHKNHNSESHSDLAFH